MTNLHRCANCRRAYDVVGSAFIYDEHGMRVYCPHCRGRKAEA